MDSITDMGTRLEFYMYENELWCKDNEGKNYLVDRSRTEVVDSILTRIRECYPDAYNALREEYRNSSLNKSYHRYMMVIRFLRCNFGSLDSTSYDIDFEKTNFERIDCPLRNECKWDGVICSPLFKTSLSASEMRVAKLWYDGLAKEEIAGVLFLSPETVNNHIRNIYYKLGVHKRAEFVKYIDDKKIL